MSRRRSFKVAHERINYQVNDKVTPEVVQLTEEGKQESRKDDHLDRSSFWSLR
jgi:hypothetical protein